MSPDATTEVPLLAPACVRALQDAVRHARNAIGPADYGNLLGHECLDGVEEWLEKVMSVMQRENSRRNVHEKSRFHWRLRHEPPGDPNETCPF